MKNGEQPGSVSGEIRLAHFGSCRVDLVCVVHRVAPRGTTERQILGIPQTGQNNAASDASAHRWIQKVVGDCFDKCYRSWVMPAGSISKIRVSPFSTTVPLRRTGCPT